jgi:hypothetical protein
LNWPFYFNCFGVKRFICSKIKVRQLSMWYQTLKFILDYCWLTFHFQFSCWIDWPIYIYIFFNQTWKDVHFSWYFNRKIWEKWCMKDKVIKEKSNNWTPSKRWTGRDNIRSN